MACGACAKNREKRKAQLERRRAAVRKKEEEKLARAAAAQAKIKTAQQELAPAVKPEEIIPELKESAE